MEVTKDQVLTVERICNKYGTATNGKVAWLMSRNKVRIKRILEDLREELSETPAMKEFNQARMELNKEYADKDAEGNPQQQLNKAGQLVYRISRLGALANAVEKLLNEKYPQAKADQKELEEKTAEVLAEKVDIDFYTMQLDKIPGYRNDSDEDNGIIESNDLVLLFDLGIVYEKDNVTELKEVAN